MRDEGKARPSGVGERGLAELVAAARTGDETALSVLCQRCYFHIHHFLEQLAPAEADDVTQEVFADLGAKLKGYRESGKFLAWLRSVAYNRFRTRRRSIRRRREEPLATDYDLALTDQTAEIFTSEKRALRAATDELPPRLKEAWELYAGGLEPRQIGSALGISAGAAAVRVSRAKDFLTGRLGGRR
jgi:RNA polymerase sigma factor (sigma-70 family)